MIHTNEPHAGADSTPSFADLPLGFGMRLAQDNEAMHSYSTMSGEQRAQLVSYIQGATSSRDAKERVARCLEQLRTGTGAGTGMGTGQWS